MRTSSESSRRGPQAINFNEPSTRVYGKDMKPLARPMQYNAERFRSRHFNSKWKRVVFAIYRTSVDKVMILFNNVVMRVLIGTIPACGFRQNPTVRIEDTDYFSPRRIADPAIFFFFPVDSTAGVFNLLTRWREEGVGGERGV